MSKGKMYKVYTIENYSKANQEFIDTGFEKYSLSCLLQALDDDKGYHMRIHNDGNYIFFGDCDWFRGSFEEFSELLIDFLSNHYKIKVVEDEISYTEYENGY